MPRPSHRSHSQAREFKKTPGNRNVIHYTRRKPKKSHCSLCKKPLSSIPRKRPAEFKKIQKNMRRPNRLESGRYCAKCLQTLIKKSVWQV